MPRLPPWLLRQARAISPRVADLLPVCRDLRSAQNELRWLHEHASKTCSSKRVHQFDSLLESYVARRARGEPLQYILGSEYFGDLEIQCRPGGLIPRFVCFKYLIIVIRLIRSPSDQRQQLRSRISRSSSLFDMIAYQRDCASSTSVRARAVYRSCSIMTFMRAQRTATSSWILLV